MHSGLLTRPHTLPAPRPDRPHQPRQRPCSARPMFRGLTACAPCKRCEPLKALQLDAESVLPFLHAPSRSVASVAQCMASLCVETYYIDRLTPSYLSRTHGLLLRTKYLAGDPLDDVDGGQLVLAAADNGAAEDSDRPCPVNYFVADDRGAGERVVAFQGSESVSSWLTNFAYDPVEFEDEQLEVLVHRGVYEVALGLYPRLERLVLEHLQAQPHRATFRFTGHSLGGAIATCLTLMLLHRGALPPAALASVHTFGAAACICEADVMVGATPRQHSADILSRLGVPPTAVRNVVLTHDLVPRVFGCDYNWLFVPDVLRAVIPNHRGLVTDRRAIFYHFVGSLMALQPEPSLPWVREEDATHPLVPPGAALYEFAPSVDNDDASSVDNDVAPARSPDCPSPVIDTLPATMSLEPAQPCQAPVAEEALPKSELHETRSALGSAIVNAVLRGQVEFAMREARLEQARAEAQEQARAREAEVARSACRVDSLHRAELAFLDYPFAADIMASTSSYGSDGLISRHHNPMHYEQALSCVLSCAPEHTPAEQSTVPREPIPAPGLYGTARDVRTLARSTARPPVLSATKEAQVRQVLCTVLAVAFTAAMVARAGGSALLCGVLGISSMANAAKMPLQDVVRRGQVLVKRVLP